MLPPTILNSTKKGGGSQKSTVVLGCTETAKYLAGSDAMQCMTHMNRNGPRRKGAMDQRVNEPTRKRPERKWTKEETDQ